MGNKFCGSCGAALESDARFCASCGTVVEIKAAAPRKQQPKARRQRGDMRVTYGLMAAGVILVVGSLMWMLLSRTPEEVANSELPYPAIARTSPEDALAMAQSGEAVLVDVRSEGQYEDSHTEGAILMPLAMIQSRHTELPAGVELILYCT